MTEAQRKALDWLLAHNGDGKRIGGAVLAAGEYAKTVPSTWKALEIGGFVETYRDANGHSRVRVSEKGKAA